jgi:hypothetical protein
MNDETRPPKRATLLIAEAVIGLIVAAVLLWSLIASGTDVKFVYQGL